jgi:hypothetical protein
MTSVTTSQLWDIMQCGKMFTLQLVHIDQLHGVMTFLLSCTVNFKIIEYTSKIKKLIDYNFFHM